MATDGTRDQFEFAGLAIVAERGCEETRQRAVVPGIPVTDEERVVAQR